LALLTTIGYCLNFYATVLGWQKLPEIKTRLPDLDNTSVGRLSPYL